MIERTPEALAIDNPAPYRDWAMSHGPALRAVDPDRRPRLARWLDRLAGVHSRDPASTPIQLELADIERGLLALPPDEADAPALAVVIGMDDPDLDSWTEVSDRLLGRTGFLRRLSPSRWRARRRRDRFLESVGLTDAAAFGRALHREAGVRPLRQRLATVLTEAGEPFRRIAPLRVPELVAVTRSTSAEFAAVEELIGRLEAYPETDTAFAVARVASAQAVNDLIEAIDQGLARHAARIASSRALDQLKPWMADEWIAERAAAIGSNLPNTAAVDALQAANSTLAAYQRFRARVPGLGNEAMDVFAILVRIRPALSALTDAELEQTVRRIISTEARLAWKSRLEEENPALLLEAAELEAKAASLAAADRDMRALNRKLLVEGIDTRDLRPLREWEDITRLAWRAREASA